MLSIIIPTYKEAANIGRLVADLRRYAQLSTIEILVVDACSPDGTAAAARAAGATVFEAPKPGRAAQLNYGHGRRAAMSSISCTPMWAFIPTT